MKILITNAYAKGSGGDMAILASLINEMRRVFEAPEIVVASIDNPDSMQSIFPDTRFTSSLITTVWDEKARRLSKLASLIKNMLASHLWAVIFRLSGSRPDFLLKASEREAMNHLADADLVVGVGGGYIREEAGLMKIVDLTLTLRMLNLSCLMGKTTVLYSQSIGPFGNKAQEMLASYVLKKICLIETRESISTGLLKRLGVRKDRILESVDAAFLVRKLSIDAELPQEFRIIDRNFSGPLVGVTARSWLDAKSQDRFERNMAEALDQIAKEYDARIVFIPQTTVMRHSDDDRIVQKRIYESMQEKGRAVFLEGAYTYQELLGIYGRLDLIIGTRFHSAIFALTGRVPALVIAYEHKAEGIMADLGLKEWVIDIRKVDAKIVVDHFDRLYDEKNDYLSRLEAALPAYIDKAQDAADKIKDAYLAKSRRN